MGVTLAVFQSSGTDPSSKVFLMTVARGEEMTSTSSCSSCDPSLSGPAAAPLLSPLIFSFTFLTVTFTSVRSSPLWWCSGSGTFSVSSLVKTLLKKLLKIAAIALLSPTACPSLSFRGRPVCLT